MYAWNKSKLTCISAPVEKALPAMSRRRVRADMLGMLTRACINKYTNENTSKDAAYIAQPMPTFT